MRADLFRLGCLWGMHAQPHRVTFVPTTRLDKLQEIKASALRLVAMERKIGGFLFAGFESGIVMPS